MIKSKTSNKKLKLDSTVNYCYSVLGFDNYNDINLEILMRAFSSHKTGDSRLNEFFSGAAQQMRSKIGAALLGSAIMLSGTPANAEDATPNTPSVTTAAASTTYALRETPSCAPLFKNNVGRELNASFSAHDYSKKNIGAVGISIFPGQDLGENTPELLGTALVNSLRRRGVQAECFVHNEEGPNGTGVNFKIAGLTWSDDAPLQVSQALNAEMMDKVAAEAKTARMLLASTNMAGGDYTPLNP